MLLKILLLGVKYTLTKPFVTREKNSSFILFNIDIEKEHKNKKNRNIQAVQVFVPK